jgi:hypothetical protein
MSTFGDLLMESPCDKCIHRFYCNTMDRSRGMGCMDLEEEGVKRD